MNYRVMRACLKRKFARDVSWFVTRVLQRSRYQKFVSALSNKKSEFFTEFSDSDVELAVVTLREKGALQGPNLPQSAVKKVYSYSFEEQCYADRNSHYPFYVNDYKKMCKKLDKDILLAQYFNIQRGCDVIEQLTKDPVLLKIAAHYLKAEPRLVGTNLWWTFPIDASMEEKEKHAHVFHYDLDDVKFIKFFFYITDVGVNDGPHVYVESSNSSIKYKNTFIKSKRFTDNEVIDAYGDDAIKVVTGKAGSCLIEDTITLHKGLTPIENPRLILQLQYAIHDFGVQNDKKI